jgi:hypothetical protein
MIATKIVSRGTREYNTSLNSSMIDPGGEI